MECRSCGGACEAVLTLGPQVPANRFIPEADLGKPEPRYDLTVCLCEDCGLAQLRTLVPAEELYSHYLFRTSSAPPLRKHIAELARTYGGPGRTVVEVGSNDGVLLSRVKETGAEVCGVDPAANLAAIANAEGCRTIVGFFGAGAEYECPRADAVIARNVFAHVPDQRAFIKAVDKILKPGGTLVIEAPWVGAMFQEADVTQVYHEHQIYLGVGSLRRLLAPLGFGVDYCVKVDLYGGSLLYECRRNPKCESAEALAYEEREHRLGCYNRVGWEDFYEDAVDDRKRFKKMLAGRAGRVAGYCASAKGSVLLQWAGIGPDVLPFIVDTTAIKQGLYTPGSHIPIVGPERLKDWNGEWLAVLSANWLDLIRKDPTLGRFMMISTDGRTA